MQLRDPKLDNAFIMFRTEAGVSETGQNIRGPQGRPLPARGTVASITEKTTAPLCSLNLTGTRLNARPKDFLSQLKPSTLLQKPFVSGRIGDYKLCSHGH